jgi:hypothetical protein
MRPVCLIKQECEWQREIRTPLPETTFLNSNRGVYG